MDQAGLALFRHDDPESDVDEELWAGQDAGQHERGSDEDGAPSEPVGKPCTDARDHRIVPGTLQNRHTLRLRDVGGRCLATGGPGVVAYRAK